MFHSIFWVDAENTINGLFAIFMCMCVCVFWKWARIKRGICECVHWNEVYTSFNWIKIIGNIVCLKWPWCSFHVLAISFWMTAVMVIFSPLQWSVFLCMVMMVQLLLTMYLMRFKSQMCFVTFMNFLYDKLHRRAMRNRCRNYELLNTPGPRFYFHWRKLFCVINSIMIIQPIEFRSFMDHFFEIYHLFWINAFHRSSVFFLLLHFIDWSSMYTSCGVKLKIKIQLFG